MKCGVDVRNVRTETTGMSKNEFYYINEIRSNAKVYGKVVYSIMKEETYKKYGLTYNQAKEKVYALSDVDEFEILDAIYEAIEEPIPINIIGRYVLENMRFYRILNGKFAEPFEHTVKTRVQYLEKLGRLKILDNIVYKL